MRSVFVAVLVLALASQAAAQCPLDGAWTRTNAQGQQINSFTLTCDNACTCTKSDGGNVRPTSLTSFIHTASNGNTETWSVPTASFTGTLFANDAGGQLAGTLTRQGNTPAPTPAPTPGSAVCPLQGSYTRTNRFGQQIATFTLTCDNACTCSKSDGGNIRPTSFTTFIYTAANGNTETWSVPTASFTGTLFANDAGGQLAGTITRQGNLPAPTPTPAPTPASACPLQGSYTRTNRFGIQIATFTLTCDNACTCSKSDGGNLRPTSFTSFIYTAANGNTETWSVPTASFTGTLFANDAGGQLAGTITKA